MAKNREYKNDVFCMLAQEPKYALEIYNAVNGSNFTDESEVIIRKLNRGIMLSMRNDTSFIIDSTYNLYEHQASYNPNMPLRSLLYFSEMIKELVKERKNDIYGSKLVKIPLPKFVVFYNGITERPETEILKLSDAYEKETDEPELELKCIVYNIRPGNNEKLLRDSKVLFGYNEFVEKVRDNIANGADNEDAINSAIDECISRDILREFFTKNRTEVLRQMEIDMTWEARIPLIKRDSREEGYNEGLSDGMERGIEQARIDNARRMIQDGELSIEKIAQYTGLPLEEINRIIND